MHPRERLPLFVYGSLRRGGQNHGFLAGRYTAVDFALLKGYCRQVAAHGWPLASPEDAAVLEGELFWITPEQFDNVLDECDRLEDLPPGQLRGEYYQRLAVVAETPRGQFRAWAYVAPAG